jgi:alkanesulfonate monooxygenase SsuD/methylene tetrahydromethanopterin reductase-like flavin-dependent oxidoreductase (luciferase family)
MVTVTNLPCRPAAVLARTITSLSALSGRRIMLGIGAGALWDMIVKLGVPRLNGGSAMRAMDEAITLIRALGGRGDPVNFDGQFYQVSGLDPADVAVPPIWTGYRSRWPSPSAGRRLDSARRLRLAQFALPSVPPAHRRRRGRSGTRPSADRHHVQLRWSHHGRAARRPTRR